MSFHNRIHDQTPDRADVIFMLTDAGKHLLEVQERPSSEYAEEWRRACYDMRIALRVSMKWIMAGHWDDWVEREDEEEPEEEDEEDEGDHGCV